MNTDKRRDAVASLLVRLLDHDDTSVRDTASEALELLLEEELAREDSLLGDGFPTASI